MSEKAMVPKSDYDLCDAENSNLRRHLLWAAQFLSREQQAELRERIRRPIEDGGATGDQMSDEKDEALRRDKAINLLCDYCDTIKDNGTARSLGWNAIYRASSDLALPATTVLGKTLYCGFIYNSTDTKWDLIALLNNFT